MDVGEGLGVVGEGAHVDGQEYAEATCGPGSFPGGGVAMDAGGVIICDDDSGGKWSHGRDGRACGKCGRWTNPKFRRAPLPYRRGWVKGDMG
jgi:hypothetical protein